MGRTLGLRLVTILVRQLSGTMTVDTGGGTEYRISFKLQASTP
jgi:two-component sensor histidine kinase